MANGDAERTIRHSLFAIGASGAGDALGRSAAHSPDCPSPAEQVLENAQNGKGWLLAEVGMDLGSAPRSLRIGALLGEPGM